MKRDALVVGINQYPFLKDTPTSKAKHLKTPAGDAEAIAHLLETYGKFEVQRLPATNRDGKLQVDPQKLVTIKDLQKAITELFKPSGQQVPETAVLFFTGHGLRRIQGDSSEGYLGTSDANPRKDVWGISLQWLRHLLQESPVRQQIIWLDCCHSGEFLNFIESDLGEHQKGRDRCFIVASRDFQVAYEAAEGNHGVLSGALLQGLDPTLQAEKWVTNYSLVDFVKQALKDAPQHPICTNSGGQIILTGEQSVISSICPYKGLAYFDFNEEDPKYFYGRTALTNQLLEKVRSSNFLAVLGASGSGKSSVVRAGLLYQLQQGEVIPGSDRWKIYKPFTPGKEPLKSLEQAIGVGVEQLEPLIKAAAADRVVLVVDQFEEVFTECRGSKDKEDERQKFFEYLMSAVKHLGNKLCLLLMMRSDFFSKCTEQEYAGLAKKIEQNLVTVLPMSQGELREAIIKPAEKVGLEVERELVDQMVDDVAGSPGDLPLLQYTLTELWQHKILNRLVLSEYTRLGRVKKALEEHANQVYKSLKTDEEKLAAKRLFLSLINIGKGTEDTRKQVRQPDLVTPQQSQELVDQLVKHLADNKLVVTAE